jgi:hypothetical protein
VQLLLVAPDHCDILGDPGSGFAGQPCEFKIAPVKMETSLILFMTSC